jgi:NAD(P)-dependent dehydrogenase (short-subunit alcohol dehydrogenase family)
MKTIFITGVSSGIGFALTKTFIQKGYRVIGSVRSESKVEVLKRTFGDNFYPVIFDLQNYNEIDIAVQQIDELLGKDYLFGIINNAGSAEIGPLLHISMDDFRKSLEILVISQLYIIQKLTKYLLPSDPALLPGRIVNISSICGLQGNYGYGCYSAAKHALEGISKTLRIELQMYGIKVIVLGPGNVKTSLWSKQSLDQIEKYRGTIYYSGLKNLIEDVNCEEFLNSIVEAKDLSIKLLKVIEGKTPGSRYTIRKVKFPFYKSKTLIWRSNPCLELLFSKIFKYL